MPPSKQRMEKKKGATSRTSSEGRKLASGSGRDKRSNPERDDRKSVIAELKIRSSGPGKK